MGRPGLTEKRQEDAEAVIGGWLDGDVPASWPEVGPLLCVYVDRVSGKGANAKQQQIGRGPTIGPRMLEQLAEDPGAVLQEVLDAHGAAPCTLSLRGVFLADPEETREAWSHWPDSAVDGESPKVYATPLRHRLQLTRTAVAASSARGARTGSDAAASNLGAAMADLVGGMGRRLDGLSRTVVEGNQSWLQMHLSQAEAHRSEQMQLMARIMEQSVQIVRLEERLDRAEENSAKWWEAIPPEAWGEDGLVGQVAGGALGLLMQLAGPTLKLQQAKAELAVKQLEREAQSDDDDDDTSSASV
jgi:hypothetical protein